MSKNTCKKWTYSFQWTDKHLSPQQMNPLKYSYDELGAAALEKLQDISSQNDGAKDMRGARERLDMYTVLRDNHEADPVLQKFWTELHTVPEWVDWDQIARGQKFFYRYAAANLTGFALQGFLGENAATGGTGEVLIRTGGFSTKILLHRLMETFQWLLQVTHGLSSVQPYGEGHVSTIRVRLLHASVRQRIMRLVESRPDYFNVEKYGIPVNALDSIHSITTFCCNPMWLQLPKMGIIPKQQEVDDYVALFRYLAYLLAAPPEYVETSEKAKAVMESMYLHELEPTRNTQVLGYNFVKCLEDLPPMNISKEFIEAGSRWFNGNELCDALDLGRPGWYYYLLMIGLSWALMTLAYLQRLIPLFDTFMINYFRDFLYRVIILSKSGLGKPSVFGFKRIPQLGKTTGKEDMPSQQKDSSSTRLDRPAERYLFVAALLGCGTILAGIASSIKVGLLVWKLAPRLAL